MMHAECPIEAVLYVIGLKFAEEFRERNEIDVKYKEIAWLYKTTYNTAFEAVKVWDEKTKLAAMLDIAVGVSFLRWPSIR